MCSLVCCCSSQRPISHRSVARPEKWDVTTRKGSDALVSAVGLLIIDEVHLLNDDRGPVIEALVARTLRLVESSQQMIRIVGLSATLPNYADVALFLKVNPSTGLFHFGPAYRPVPLTQTFIGVNQNKVQVRYSSLPHLFAPALFHSFLLRLATSSTPPRLSRHHLYLPYYHLFRYPLFRYNPFRYRLFRLSRSATSSSSRLLTTRR